MLDNAMVHKSRLTRMVMDSLGIPSVFLPIYCPEMAPVERAFLSIKSKLRSKLSCHVVKFDKDAGIKMIFMTIAQIKLESWFRHWNEAIKQAKRAIMTGGRQT